MKKYIVGLLALALMGSTAYGYSGGPQKGIDVGIGARATEKIYYQLGSSSTFTQYFGSETVSGSGTSGHIGTTTGLPSIEVSRSGGSSSVNIAGFNSVKIDGVDIATGSLGGKLDAVDGEGTRTTLNSPTIAGVGTVSATINYNGVSISPTEASYVDGLSQNIQTSLDSKQVAGEYITGITADGKTGTTTIQFVPGTDFSITSVESGGSMTVTFQPTGSASAKPAIQEGGTSTTAAASFLNFNASDFDTTNSPPGTDIALSAEQRGTTTPTANTVMKAGSTGTSSLNWFDAGFCYAYRTTALSNITTGTWTNVPLDSDINDSRYGTHSTAVNPEQIRVLVPGMYEVAARAQARHSAASIGIRLCKNNETEIPGSFSTAYMNYGDSNTGMPIIIAPIQVRLTANDYIYMQVAHNAAGTATAIDYSITGGMPSPTTNTLATLTLKKIGE